MRMCEVCEKGSKMVGHRVKLRGHYNPTNWTRKYPNLQNTTTPSGEKVLACVQCIRTFAKPARVKKVWPAGPKPAEKPKAPVEKKIKEPKAPAAEKTPKKSATEKAPAKANKKPTPAKKAK